MTPELDYADTLRYVQHFRSKGCQSDIVNNTEGLINLFWLNIDLIDQLKRELEKKIVNIVRLKEMISGINSHSGAPTDSDKKPNTKPPVAHAIDPNIKKPSKAKGHGRRGAKDYPGVKIVVCEHDTLKAGDICPQCRLGSLRNKPSKVRIQIDGHAPLMGSRYELEQLECSACLFTSTASAPVDLAKKYTPKAKATLAYLHYGMGVPYYRLAKMQEMLGVPIAVSTQSELMAAMMGPVHAMFNYVVIYAAQSDCVYQDDTTVKILSFINDNKNGRPTRKGMYTSGFIADGEHKVVLYFSGRAHAGENFDLIMAHRRVDKGEVIRMADALSANSKHEAAVLEAKCNSHAFRRFRSLLSTYPDDARFVLNIYAQVYDHDDYCKSHTLDKADRLVYHQEHSQPLMDKLKAWVDQVLSGRVEPNCILASECQYLSNHWTGLTQFLHTAGAPLDNNVLEAILKTMIMYRKNSQFFKTAYSAQYGSRLVSLIVTCRVNNVDAIDYLTVLQQHEQAVWRNPEAWTPWQYQHTLSQMTTPQANAA